MTIDELSTAAGRDEAKAALVARVKLTYLPHGTVLSEVATIPEGTTHAEASAGPSESKDSHGAETTKKTTTKESTTKETAAAEAEHELDISALSDADAISIADSLTVQADVYDVYFTEFVMQ